MFLLVSLMQTLASNKLERCKDNNKYKVLKGNDEQNFHDDHNIKKNFFFFCFARFQAKQWWIHPGQGVRPTQKLTHLKTI